MCLAIPGRLVTKFVEDGLAMGKVDFDGVAKLVCLEHVLEAAVGDYVLVHVGFALTRIDQEEAQRIFDLIAEFGGSEEARLEVPG